MMRLAIQNSDKDSFTYTADGPLFWGDAYIAQSYIRKWVREYVKQHNEHVCAYILFKLFDERS